MFADVCTTKEKQDDEESNLDKREESVHDPASSRREELNEANHHEGEDGNKPYEAAVWILVRMNRYQGFSTNLQNIRP